MDFVPLLSAIINRARLSLLCCFVARVLVCICFVVRPNCTRTASITLGTPWLCVSVIDCFFRIVPISNFFIAGNAIKTKQALKLCRQVGEAKTKNGTGTEQFTPLERFLLVGADVKNFHQALCRPTGKRINKRKFVALARWSR